MSCVYCVVENYAWDVCVDSIVDYATRCTIDDNEKSVGIDELAESDTVDIRYWIGM